MTGTFPQQRPGLMYLTEGGQETEILFKYGFDLPHFAMLPLLDDPRAMAELTGMYERYLDTAAQHGFGALMGGLDYRGALTGPHCSATHRLLSRSCSCVQSGFCDVAEPYLDQLPAVLFAGIIGRNRLRPERSARTIDVAGDHRSDGVGMIG